MSKIDKLLAVLDLPKYEQLHFLVNAESSYFDIKTKADIAGRRISLADLAFRLNNGEVAGKKPIEHIINALINNLDG